MERSFLHKYLEIHKLHPLRTVKSNYINTSSLLILRSIIGLYCIGVVCTLFVYHKDAPLYYFIYLTHLSYFGITVYFIITIYLTIRYYINKSYIPFENLPWPLRLLYFLLFQSIVTLAPLVTAIYWSALYSTDKLIFVDSTYTYLSFSMHVLNLLFCWTEFVLSCNLVVMRHLLILYIVFYLYVPFAIVIHDNYNIWVYSFLNYIDRPLTFALYVVGLFAIILILQFIYTCVYKFRDHYATNDNCFEDVLLEPYTRRVSQMSQVTQA